MLFMSHTQGSRDRKIESKGEQRRNIRQKSLPKENWHNNFLNSFIDMCLAYNKVHVCII